MSRLCWKEWHEQSWKLGFSCLVLCALAWIGLRARIIADETMIEWVCFLGVILLPVLSSTGLLPAERADGSFESLLAMPVSPWRILLAKTLSGIVLCAIPLIAAGAISILAAGEREMTVSAMISLYGRTTLAALSLFVWMMALTSRLPNETRAGLLSMGLLIFWILATVGLCYDGVPPAAVAMSPFAFVYNVNNNFANMPQWPVMLAVQILLAALLWIWTAKRLSGLEGLS
jgi:hypothetical protein